MSCKHKCSNSRVLIAQGPMQRFWTATPKRHVDFWDKREARKEAKQNKIFFLSETFQNEEASLSELPVIKAGCYLAQSGYSDSIIQNEWMKRFVVLLTSMLRAVRPPLYHKYFPSNSSSLEFLKHILIIIIFSFAISNSPYFHSKLQYGGLWPMLCRWPNR